MRAAGPIVAGRRAWAFYDRRTGKRCGMAVAGMSRKSAERELEWLRVRDAKGGRPDIHDLIPHLDVVELTDQTWGSRPGDLITNPDSAP